jgi:hypothetical protein
MYTGNGNGGYNGNSGYATIGGMRIRPIYLYAAVAVAVLVAVYFVIRFFNTGLVMHFGAAAGVLLLLANLRELLGSAFAQRNSTALLNCLIGGALLFAWLSQLISALLWIPAVVLLLVSAPLAIGRATVYSTYVAAARSAVSSARRTMGR